MKTPFGKGKLRLDRAHAKLGGVCAGIALYLDVPRFWIRIAAVLGLFFNAIAVLIAYGLAYVILDDGPEDERAPRKDDPPPDEQAPL